MEQLSIRNNLGIEKKNIRFCEGCTSGRPTDANIVLRRKSDCSTLIEAVLLLIFTLFIGIVFGFLIAKDPVRHRSTPKGANGTAFLDVTYGHGPEEAILCLALMTPHMTQYHLARDRNFRFEETIEIPVGFDEPIFVMLYEDGTNHTDVGKVVIVPRLIYQQNLDGRFVKWRIDDQYWLTFRLIWREDFTSCPNLKG